MKTFEFKAFDQETKKYTYTGTIQAESGEEAILKLIQQKILPTSLVEISQTQAALSSQIANFKKIRAKLGGTETPSLPSITIKPKRQLDWMYLMFAAIVAAIVITSLVIYV